MSARPLLFLLLAASAACGDAAERPLPAGPGASRVDTVTSANAAAIAYEVVGDTGAATTLVFVHCWSCDRGYWTPQVGDLSRDHRVVTLDLAGHGGSTSGTRTDFTTASFGADVAAVVRDLGLQRVVLVGHSMGGGVIVEAARQLPGVVRGLVWVDAFHQVGGGGTPAELEAFLVPFRRNFAQHTAMFARSMFPPNADTTLVNRVVADLSGADSAVALSAMRNAFHYDASLAAALAELRLPVLAINAALFPSDSASLDAHGVRLRVLPGVGHFLQLEDSVAFNAALRATLQEIPQ